MKPLSASRVNPWTKTHSRWALNPSPHPWEPVMATSARMAHVRKGSPQRESIRCTSYITDDEAISSQFCLGWGGVSDGISSVSASCFLARLLQNERFLSVPKSAPNSKRNVVRKWNEIPREMFLRLRNPGFGNQKPRVFINRHAPFAPSLLVWESVGVHSTMERSAGASFGGFWGRVRVAIYENPGFPNPGFRNLCMLSLLMLLEMSHLRALHLCNCDGDSHLAMPVAA